MKSFRKKLAALTIALVLSFGVIWGAQASNSDIGHLFQDMGSLVGSAGNIQGAAPIKDLADAAKQLDGLSQSGGPTAEQNQKIQELTFNLSAQGTANFGNDNAFEADNKKQQA